MGGSHPCGSAPVRGQVGEPEPVALLCAVHAGRTVCQGGARRARAGTNIRLDVALTRRRPGDLTEDAACLRCEGPLRWAVTTQERVSCQFLLASVAGQPADCQDGRLWTEMARSLRPRAVRSRPQRRAQGLVARSARHCGITERPGGHKSQSVPLKPAPMSYVPLPLVGAVQAVNATLRLVLVMVS